MTGTVSLRGKGEVRDEGEVVEGRVQLCKEPAALIDFSSNAPLCSGPWDDNGDDARYW